MTNTDQTESPWLFLCFGHLWPPPVVYVELYVYSSEFLPIIAPRGVYFSSTSFPRYLRNIHPCENIFLAPPVEGSVSLQHCCALFLSPDSKIGRIKEGRAFQVSLTRIWRRILTSGTAKMRDSDIQVDSWYIELTFNVGILRKKKLNKNLWTGRSYLKAGWGGLPSPSSRLCSATSKVSKDAKPWNGIISQNSYFIHHWRSLLVPRIVSNLLLHNYQVSRIQEFLISQDMSIQVSYTCVSTTETIMHRLRERTSKKTHLSSWRKCPKSGGKNLTVLAFLLWWTGGKITSWK